MMDELVDAAMSAMPVYRVGVRFDGVPVLSHDDDTPEADTEVWFADGWGCPNLNECGPDCPKRTMCGKRVSVLDVEDLTDVSWFATPTEFEAPKVAAVASPEMAAEPAEPEGPTEAEKDEMARAVEAAEERLGQLEALVASVVLAEVVDVAFVDDARQSAVTLPVAAVAEVRDGFARMAEGMALIAALDADLLPQDLSDRVDAVMDRLDALEESVASMMLDDVSDEQMYERKDSSTFVDETRRDDTDDESDDDDSTDDESDDDESKDSKYPRKKKRKPKVAATGLPLTVDARDDAADAGEALPDGKLPIRSLIELRSAIKLRGHVKGHSEDAIREHIIKRARALGATDELPEEWR